MRRTAAIFMTWNVLRIEIDFNDCTIFYMYYIFIIYPTRVNIKSQQGADRYTYSIHQFSICQHDQQSNIIYYNFTRRVRKMHKRIFFIHW